MQNPLVYKFRFPLNISIVQQPVMASDLAPTTNLILSAFFKVPSSLTPLYSGCKHISYHFPKLSIPLFNDLLPILKIAGLPALLHSGAG